MNSLPQSAVLIIHFRHYEIDVCFVCMNTYMNDVEKVDNKRGRAHMSENW